MLKARVPLLQPGRLRVLDTKAGATRRVRGRAWMTTRERIAKRDRYRCGACGRPWDSQCDQVDHVVPLEQGGSNDDGNLQLLCGECHRVKSADEARRRAGR